MDLKKSIHSGNIVKQAPGGDPRVLRFIASNESPDRDNDIIDSAGWNLQNFNKNPVFLWAHDYSTPSIGKVIHCEKDVRNKQLIADVRFPSMAEMAPDGNPSEHAKFVETIFNLYKNGYLNAVSVGCKYLKYEQRSDGAEASKEMYNRGIHVMEAELWELSGCPVPSNQDAMLQASALPGVEKSALDIVIKSIKAEEKPEEKPEEKKEAAPLVEEKALDPEKKEGRRLSAATLSMIDDLEDGMKEMDEAIEAMKKCRDGMSTRIAGLRNGYSEEPGNDDTDDKKGIIEIVPDVAIEIAD